MRNQGFDGGYDRKFQEFIDRFHHRRVVASFIDHRQQTVGVKICHARNRTLATTSDAGSKVAFIADENRQILVLCQQVFGICPITRRLLDARNHGREGFTQAAYQIHRYLDGRYRRDVVDDDVSRRRTDLGEDRREPGK